MTSRIDALLEAARARLRRLAAHEVPAALRRGAVLVDIRPQAQRGAEGEVPGALVIERNVLEWRLDPSCPFHIPEVTSPHMRVVLVCNEGFGSSLAAATLRRLGLSRATDLVGGFAAWRELVG